MKEWTREERYRDLKSADEIKDLYDRIQKSKYRQLYHVQPITGLSSDPNGFAFHQGKWHLCYQWCPWGAVHGIKIWYHVVSDDLIHWDNVGIGLNPDCFYDNKGCHSGSGISKGDDLYFFYTGNHRDENWVRTPYTCAAILQPDGSLKKLPEPLFGPRDDYTDHQRDPKIVWNEEKQQYYIFIGAQTKQQTGTVLIYESADLLTGWKFAGQINVPGYEKFGGMWECPYIGHIGDKDLLIFSPQYTTLPGRANSTNHNVYIIGHMDYDTLTFTPESDYNYLDFGFDFYAAQGAANVGDPDKGILIAWIGLPDNHYPTVPEEWEGSMTLPRELRIRDGRLYQTPIENVTELRDIEVKPEGKLPPACEMEIEVPDGDFDLNLFTKADGSGGMRIHYDSAKKVCTVDRTGMDKRFNVSVGEVLDMPVVTPLKKLRIFIDRSSTEVFANDGEATFTTHSYPTDDEFNYTVTDGANIKMWTMKRSVTDRFVV